MKNVKVKEFINHNDEKINNFIKDKDVVDIKYCCCTTESHGDNTYTLVIYKDCEGSTNVKD